MFVTIREAAEQLGVSADTVRRRIKAGEIVSRKEEGGPGGSRWLVEIPDAAAGPDEPAGDASGANEAQARIEGLEALVAELRSERDAWKEQAANTAAAFEREQDASRELRLLLGREQERTRELPAQITEAIAESLPETTPPVGFWARFRASMRGE